LSRDFSLLIVMQHSVPICFKLLQIETKQIMTKLSIRLSAPNRPSAMDELKLLPPTCGVYSGSPRKETISIKDSPAQIIICSYLYWFA